MKKADLKTGMHFKVRSGKVRVVLLGTSEGDTTCACRVVPDSCIIERLCDYFELDNWDCELVDITNLGNSNDIMSVYGMYGDLLWERNENKEMTVAEIENELGYKIKIVK